ncbi:MAG: response regulator [Chloroflexi bacterium]|nr:response regulator [Chloroflexota bacterium]
MGARMRAFDWAATPLGPVERWPQALKTATRILLTSRQPMFVWWGDELTNIYNDAYRTVLGGKHPGALGRPASEVWREIWPQIEPRAVAALGGLEGTFDESLLLIMERNGYQEETYYTFSYSPVPNDEGGVGGIFCANNEDTQRIIGQRQLSLLRELAAATADARTIDAACTLSARGLAANPHDLPFALLYLVDRDGERAVLAGAAGIEPGHPAAPHALPLTASTPPAADGTSLAAGGVRWPLGEVARTGEPAHLIDLDGWAGILPTGAWDRPPCQAVALPVTSSGRAGVAGVLVAGLNPYRQYDDTYRGFLDLVVGQIAASMATAQAYEDERRRAEALAELDRAKTVFFSNVSHEFRTPLTLLLGPTEDALADDLQPLPPAQRERLEVARRNARRLLRLVNTLLDFSRIEAGRVQASYEATNLPAFSADLASNFRSAVERASLTLVVDCPPLPAGVTAYVDREMWEKIVLNLISNAFKFTFAGSIAVSLRVRGDHVELQVADTGTGIAADELPRVFERFHRVHGARGRTHEGSGIGLALVRELVQLHGGTISVESVLDRGTTFTVTLPLGKEHLPADRIGVARTVDSTATGAAPFIEEAMHWLPDAPSVDDERGWLDVLASDAPALRAPPLRAPLPGQRVGPRIRVLLADDNRDMREYVTRLLQGFYQVEAVADGEAALHAARARRPGLVLSDVMMPRMDGFELVAALRADPATREIPILLLSARAGEEARIEGLQGGADDYLTKPFSARELLARVETQVQLSLLRTESVRQERAARSQLERLLEQAPAAMCLLDGPDHVYTLANARYVELVGDRDVMGKSIRDALPELEGQGIIELLDRVYQTGEPYVASELPAQLAVGEGGALKTIYFNLVYAPVRTVDGAVESVFVHAYDVTAQVEARQVAEEAVRIRDEFLSIASHELRNPVAGLKGTAQLARRSQRTGRLDAERLERYLSSIESGAGRLATLTEDLLDVSRLQRGELPLRRRRIDLAALVRESVARQPLDPAQVVRLQVTEGLPRAFLDPDRVEQIATNLLDNAAKYSPDRGEIRVTLTSEGDGVLLLVEDRGIGLPPGAAEHIFEPFGRAPNAQTANIPGLGLGLYICRQIAQQHGGRLWAESAGEGQGTTFALWLPLHADGQADGDGLAEPPSAPD